MIEGAELLRRYKSAIAVVAASAAALTVNVCVHRANRRLHDELLALEPTERAYATLRAEHRQLIAGLAQRPKASRPAGELDALRQQTHGSPPHSFAGYHSLETGGRRLIVTPKTPREDIIEFLHSDGLSSPMRAWQTMLHAGQGHDREIELLEATFCFDEKGQARLDAFLAALPESARSRFRGGKSLVAPLFDQWLWKGNRPQRYSPRRDVPVAGDPSRADAYFRVTYASGETREDRFPFKRFADGWRYGPLSESVAEELLALLDPTTGLPRQRAP